MSLPPNERMMLERAIGEAIVDTVYALAYGIGEDDAKRPLQEAEDAIDDCREELDALSEIAHTAGISFSDAAYQYGVAVLRKRLGPSFDYVVLDILVKWAVKWYETRIRGQRMSGRPLASLLH